MLMEFKQTIIKKMTEIQTSLKQVVDETKGTTAKLVAVSKYHPVESLREAYDCGQRVFGESHVQELCMKYDVLPKDIQWHFIGHLQTNKVKYIAPFVSLIHAVDTMKLLCEINKQAMKNDRVIPCLLQVHIAKEETKFGFTPQELLSFLEEGEWRNLNNVKISGIMCMATNTDDEQQIRTEFKTVKQLYDQVKNQYFNDCDCFSELSMGMSHDYHIALQEGSTMIRVGSKIFGARNYET